MSQPKKVMKFDSDTALKSLSGLFSLMDTIKNAPLTPGVSTREALDKSLRDFPESAIENHIDGKKLLEKALPEWSEDNPGLSSAAGLLWDIADPSLLIPGAAAGKLARVAAQKGAGKLAAKADKVKAVVDGLDKVLNPGGVVIQEAGKGIAKIVGDRAARGYIKKTITKSATRKNSDSLMDEAEKIVKYSKEKGYNFDLLSASKLRDMIEGPLKEVDLGKLERGGGIKDALGKEVSQVLDSAVVKGAPKADRTQIKKALEVAVKKSNSNLNEAGVRDIEKFSDTLKDILKPTKDTKYKIPEFKPEKSSMPQIETKDYDNRIEAIRGEIAKAKEAANTRLAQKRERELAEKAVNADNEAARKAFEKERQEILKMQEEEGLEVLSKTAKENEEILRANEKIKAAIEKAKENASAKRKKTEILQPFKVDPSADAETKVAMEIYNKRAKQSIKDAINKADLKTMTPKQIAELESQIRPLSTKKPDIVVEDLTLPPPVPKQVDVPPPVPETGKSLEDLLAELQDATSQREALRKTNAQIGKEATEAAATTRKGTIPAETIIEETPVVSDVKSLWELRKSMAKQLNELQLNQAPSDIATEKGKILRETMLKIEDTIQSSIEQIPVGERGNLKDLYLKAKKEYADAEDFTKFLRELDSIQGKSGVGYVPANRTGLLSETMEAALGPETQLRGARLLDTLSQDNVMRMNIPRAGSQMGQNILEMATEGMEGETMEEEIPSFEEITEVVPGRGPSSGPEIAVTPEGEPVEVLPEVQPTEIPWGQGVNLGEPNIQDKIFETLNPQPMTFNPYVNEEILNTLLPRDTERLIANPMVLKAKLSQAAPQHLPMLEDMLQNDPEGVRKAAPMIAQLVPSMFERDEYNAFDGRIIDPMMQQKFLVDLKRDEAMSAIEKAKVATRVRRGEPV